MLESCTLSPHMLRGRPSGSCASLLPLLVTRPDSCGVGGGGGCCADGRLLLLTHLCTYVCVRVCVQVSAPTCGRANHQQLQLTCTSIWLCLSYWAGTCLHTRTSLCAPPRCTCCPPPRVLLGPTAHLRHWRQRCRQQQQGGGGAAAATKDVVCQCVLHAGDSHQVWTFTCAAISTQTSSVPQ